jgi:hypothetical protein
MGFRSINNIQFIMKVVIYLDMTMEVGCTPLSMMSKWEHFPSQVQITIWIKCFTPQVGCHIKGDIYNWTPHLGSWPLDELVDRHLSRSEASLPRVSHRPVLEFLVFPFMFTSPSYTFRFLTDTDSHHIPPFEKGKWWRSLVANCSFLIHFVRYLLLKKVDKGRYLKTHLNSMN